MKVLSKVRCVGLDCHKNFSTATGRDAENRVVFRQRLNHADRELLRGELSSWPAGTPVILEGTFGWGWMSDELRRAGLAPHLCSGRKVAGWREARGMAKSNKRDADLISELWSQQPRWWEVWCAPPEVRDMRELLRYRMSLVRWQTGLKNRIHATLHRHGLVHGFSDLFGVAGRAWLLKVITDPNSLMREVGRETLRGYLESLDQVRKRQAQATRRFRRELRRHPAAGRLITMPGISTVLAYTIVAEVGQIERFPSGRHLCRYSLLAPMSDDSGEERARTPLGRHVGRAGRLTLKWAWIAAARGAVRRAGPLKELFDRYTDQGRHDRNRGYIAVAHRMCQVGYVLWKKQVNYQTTPPPRPGSEQWRQQQAREKRGEKQGEKQELSPSASPTARTARTAGVPADGCESPLRKTPAGHGIVFCGGGNKAKERVSKTKKPRTPGEHSRPGTGQPQAAMAAESDLRQTCV